MLLCYARVWWKRWHVSELSKSSETCFGKKRRGKSKFNPEPWLLGRSSDMDYLSAVCKQITVLYMFVLRIEDVQFLSAPPGGGDVLISDRKYSENPIRYWRRQTIAPPSECPSSTDLTSSLTFDLSRDLSVGRSTEHPDNKSLSRPYQHDRPETSCQDSANASVITVHALDHICLSFVRICYARNRTIRLSTLKWSFQS